MLVKTALNNLTNNKGINIIMDCVGSSFFNMVKIYNKSLNLCSLDAIWV